MEVPMDEKTVARFWAKVDKNGPVPAHCPELGPCWIWTAYCSSGRDGGYGKFKVGGLCASAHRVAWEIATGAPPPDDRLVCHSCDVRRCVNGGHLFLGTSQANSDDMWQKGRARLVIGAANGQCKLTDEQVIAIRTAHRGLGHRQVAKLYGVGKSVVSYIRRGEHRRHVTPPTAPDSPSGR
jgi:hypothetical protein